MLCPALLRSHKESDVLSVEVWRVFAQHNIDALESRRNNEDHTKVDKIRLQDK